MVIGRTLLFCALGVIFTLTSCETIPEEKSEFVELFIDDIGDFSRRISDHLKEFDLETKNIGVATFVNLDNLENSSSFGRYLSEQLTNELHKQDFIIRELRQRMSIAHVPGLGEFVLSRQERTLMKKFHVDALLSGTYTVIGKKLVVNARIVGVEASRVVSVGRMVVDMEQYKHVEYLLYSAISAHKPIVKVRAYENEEGY